MTRTAKKTLIAFTKKKMLPISAYLVDLELQIVMPL